MPSPSRTPKALLAAIAGLLLAFAALAAYMKFYANRVRFEADPVLLAEASGATILEEKRPPPAADRPWPQRLVSIMNILIASLKTPPAADRPWPQWLGPSRDGVVEGPGLSARWPEKGPKVLWEKRVGRGYSAVSVAGGRAYTLFAQGAEEVVVCWRADEGKELWRHAYKPSKTDFQYGGPRSTPTIDGRHLFVLGSAGLLLCLDAQTGEPVWDKDLREALGARPLTWGFACSPLVLGGRVFVAGGRRGRAIAAFDRDTGKLLWSALKDPAGYSSPVAVTLADGEQQVVFLTGTRLVGVNPETGELRWHIDWRTFSDINAATPLHFRAAAGGQAIDYVFITSGYGTGCGLVKIERDGDGCRARAVYKSNELECQFGTPVRHGGHVYALDEKRDLTCLELLTGKLCWRAPDNFGGFKKGSLIRVNDELVVLGEEGHLARVKCDPTQYTELARARPLVNKRSWTVPVLANGRLYLRDEARVVCLEVGK
jgi:outer membrane protein assembly factor BamB